MSPSGGIVLPGGMEVQMQEQSQETQILMAIANNQRLLYNMLQQMSNQLEIQIRIACGVDTKSMWKARFQEAARLAKEQEELATQAVESEDETVEDDDAQVPALPSDV